jgi:hypothetical protein
MDGSKLPRFDENAVYDCPTVGFQVIVISD